MSDLTTTRDADTRDESRHDLSIDNETRQLLEAAASYEGRPMSSIVDDAVKLYLRSRSEDYRIHLDLAHHYLHAVPESEEHALIEAELSVRLAMERGPAPGSKGGDALAVRARIRQRQISSGDA